MGSLLILGAGGLLLASDNDVGLVLGAAAGVFSVLGAVSGVFYLVIGILGIRNCGRPETVSYTQLWTRRLTPCWLMYNLLPAWDRLSQVQICRKQTSLRSSIIITGSMIAQRLPAGKDRAG